MATASEILRPVESSMFVAAGYDDSSWTLLLQFKSTGETRSYKGVSPDLADEALTSKSLGSFYNQNIKGKYEHEILAAEQKSQPEILPKVEGLLADRRPVEETGLAEDELDLICKASPTAPSPVPDLDAQAAIALPQQKAPEIDSIVEQGKKVAQDALTIRVTDAISYTSASLTLKVLQSARDRAFAFLDPMREAAFKAYQFIQKRQKEGLDPIDNAIAHVKRAMATYAQQQETIRQEKLAEERRKAEEEARRLQQEQSQQLTLAEIQDSLEAGDTARAEELVSRPIEVPLPYVAPAAVAPAVPEVQGLGTRKNWKVAEEEIDLVIFLRAVKDGKIPIEQAAKLVKPNVPALNKLAKSLESAFLVPGVRAFNDSVISSRRA